MKFEIELYEAYPHVCFYTVRKAGGLHTETELFFQRFESDPTYSKDVAEIKAIMRKMGTTREGAIEDRFRFENNVRALPKTPNGLRLYCVRCHSNTVILCNGGKKSSGTTQGHLNTKIPYLFTKQVEELYTERIQDKSLENPGRFINGNKVFDTDLFDDI